jgi:hypothetical protein
VPRLEVGDEREPEALDLNHNAFFSHMGQGVGRASEYSVYAVWRCVRRGP